MEERLRHTTFQPIFYAPPCCSSFHSFNRRISWRLARLRDYKAKRLTPYFTTGSDTLADLAGRLADGALAFVRSIPLGMQVAVAFEAAEILRKHGMNGIYTLVLRKEFVAAAGLLQRVAR